MSDGQVPDWRDRAAYEPLLEADRSFFAWEWLRRNQHYRAAAERALEVANRDPGWVGEAPERWGLHAFVEPHLAVPRARPVWCADSHPFVLGVEAGPPQAGDVFELERFASMSTLLTDAAHGERLLISDGLRSIRIDVLSGSIAGGSAELRYQLIGLSSAVRPLLTLRRLLALCRTGQFCRSLHPAEARVKRWLMLLRAHDALAAGANQRDIAGELLEGREVRERWRVEAPSLRSQAQRLVQGARRMAKQRFWELLG